MVFETPKSVRQIGEPKANPRIYVEDYVISFAKQLAGRADDREVMGVLLGKSCMRKGNRVVKISGMVVVEGMEGLTGHTFTHEMWTEIYTQIKEHFTDIEIVGWYYAKSEMPLVCTERLEKIQSQNFAGGDKLLYMYDEAEKEDVFFIENNGKMERQPGYFIYYERNPQMQEYMLQKTPHIPEEVPDGAVQNMRTLLEEKKRKEKSRKSHGLGTVAAILALILCATALSNQALLEKKITQLKSKLGQAQETVSKKTEVETLQGNVAPVSKSAVTVKVITDSSIKPSATPTPTPKPGDKIPASNNQSKPATKKNKDTYYTVKEGDTLSQIASRIYENIAYAKKIQLYNGLTSPNQIKIGQKLRLPKK